MKLLLTLLACLGCYVLSYGNSHEIKQNSSAGLGCMLECPQNITVNANPSTCSAVVNYTVNLSSGCPQGTPSQDFGLPSGATFPIGTTTNDFTFEFSPGSVAFCSFTVTVVDAQAPTAVCQDLTIQLDGNNMATIAAQQLDGGSTDDCGIQSFSASQTSFTDSNIGGNVITLTVQDVGNNTADCMANVTVTPAPTALTISLVLEGRMGNINGTYTIQLYDATGTTLIQTFTPTVSSPDTDITLTNLTPGTYRIGVKEAKFLQRVTDLTLATGNNSLNVGTLLAGDTNNDNFVTILDFSLLASTFNLASTDNGYDARADFNGDNQVSATDFSLLAVNFNTAGETISGSMILSSDPNRTEQE